eukprot:XP_001709826.1 Hypothetical protein GL50803_105640 [Giardia lamblia ATCC 50803]
MVSMLPTRTAHGYAWIIREAAVMLVQSIGQVQLLVATNVAAGRPPM